MAVKTEKEILSMSTPQLSSTHAAEMTGVLMNHEALFTLAKFCITASDAGT